MMLGSRCSPCCGDKCPTDGKPRTDPADEGTWVPSGTWPNVTWTFQPNPGNGSGETWFFYGSFDTSKRDGATFEEQTDWGNLCNWYSSKTNSPGEPLSSVQMLDKRASRLPPANAVIHVYSRLRLETVPEGYVAKAAYLWAFDNSGFINAMLLGPGTWTSAGMAHDATNGTIFLGSSTSATATVEGGATFVRLASDARNYGTVNGGATFRNFSANHGAVNGGAAFLTGAENWVTGTVNGGATFTASPNLGTVNGGAIFSGASLLSSANNNGTVNGGATFSNGAGNSNIVNGGATFSSATNYGIVHQGATFSDGSGNYGSVYNGATYNGTINWGDTRGGATFNGSAVNRYRVFDGAVFNNNSINAGDVYGGAVFNDTSVNDWRVHDGATFNDQSASLQFSLVYGPAVFNDSACSHRTTFVLLQNNTNKQVFSPMPNAEPLCNGSAPTYQNRGAATCGCG